MLWTDLRILIVDTGRVWWRLLPQILGIYLLGWLCSQIALNVAVVVGDINPWLTLAIFAFTLLSRLVAIVLILRVVGRELGIRDMIPDEESVRDERDSSITHLLSVTLLPFLGIYAAFGEVTQAAQELAAQQYARYGAFGSENTVLSVLNVRTVPDGLRLLAIMVALYSVRRLIDYLHDRSGRRILGLAVALVESNLLLVVVMGGIRIAQEIRIWLMDRAFLGWFASVTDAAASFFAIFQINLPAVLTQLTAFFAEQVWPVFYDVISQPLIWLAVAALIYGSQVLSIAELWRKGQPIARLVPGASTFARHADKVRARRVGPPPRGVSRVAHEAREAFLGDIDDKYLPTFHSLRLILRAGAVFLGAYVLVYALQTTLANYFSVLATKIIGGHLVDFWIVFGPSVDLIENAAFEPLRLCLLAVAFRRCLELFRGRAHPDDQPESYLLEATPAARAAAEAG